MRSGERASERASKAVKQPVRQAGRQAGVPDGYGNHRTCFQAPETTKRAQTNLLHSQQSVRPPSIYCVRQEESLPRIGAAQLRRMHRYRKDERSLIVSAPRDVRLPLLPPLFCTSEYRWLSTSIRREHYIEKRTPVNWIAVIVLALY